MKNCIALALSLLLVMSADAQMSIIGPATPAGDLTTDFDMVQNPGDSAVWTLSIYLSDGAVKFRKNHDPMLTWGDSTFPTGTGIPGGPDIPADAGFYLVSFDTSTLAYSFSQGFIGINNASPNVALDISGAFAQRTAHLDVTSNAATMPANVGLVNLTGAPTGPVSLATMPGTDGQRLMIHNSNTSGQPASFGGLYDISAGGTIELVYVNAVGWKVTSGGGGSDVFWSQTGATDAISNTNVGGFYSQHSTPVFVDPGALPLPVSGAGTRLMWIPEKSAFRVGTVEGDHWDTDSIGTWSFASGFNTKAKGLFSTALGYNTTASGWYSTALGYNTTASGYLSTVLGNNTMASGEYSTALGFQTTASGYSSTALGFLSSASGSHSTALGYQTTASGFYSTTFGNQTTASGDYSTALGYFSTASGYSSTALGYSSTALGYSSTALGYLTYASGLTSTAFGYQTTASGDYSTAFGNQTIASGGSSTSLGENTIASGYNSTALGVGTTASGWYSTALGSTTTASGYYSTAIGSNTMSLGPYSTTLGYATTASEYYSTALGNTTMASGYSSTALGNLTTASGEASTALGGYTTASGSVSTALGYTTTASGYASTALGAQTTASGYSSTALGSETIASGSSSTALGKNATARSYLSVALGTWNDTIAGSDPTLWVSTDPLLTVGNGSGAGARQNAMTIYKNGNTDISGYTRLGTAAESAPRIKMKEFASTTSGTNDGPIYVAHGLTSSKIISVEALVEYYTGGFVSVGYTALANLNFNYLITPTDIVIVNNAVDCTGDHICDKPVKVVVTYKE